MKRTEFIGIIGDENDKSIAIDIITYVFNSNEFSGLLIKDEFIKVDDKEYKKESNEYDDYKKRIYNAEIDFVIIDVSFKDVYNQVVGDKSLDSILDLRLENINDRVHNYEKSFLYKKLKRNGIAIVSSDQKKNIHEFNLLQNKIIITYGLDMKSTVTTSSVPFRDETTLICCIQRGITTFNGDEIEPMEFPIKFYYHDKVNALTILPIITLCIRYGIAIENLQEILSKYRG